MGRLKFKRLLLVILLATFCLVGGGCDNVQNGCGESGNNQDESVNNNKVGILFLQVGSDEEYSFNWMPQFMRNMYDLFPAGQLVGGPKEGGDCYTVIHYADEIEADTCGVAEGTAIDVFCNVYQNTKKYPVQSITDVGMLAYIGQCGDRMGNFWTQFMFSGMHSTVDPETQTVIPGPIVSDPNGSGIGIEDFLEVAGFEWMHTVHRLPGAKDVHRKQLLKWWYGNDAPGYSPDPEELINIEDQLKAAMPDTEFVFRHGWESYLANLDPYGNPKKLSYSAETAIDELIKQEKVGRIVVLHTYPAFSNLTQYGHDWRDKDGKGVSAVDGKTFAQCIQNLNDGFGPDTRSSRSNYLDNKPMDSHWEHPFPMIQHFVESRNANVAVTFAPPYGTFDEFGQGIIQVIEHTIAKYDIPESAKVKVILGHHGYYSGYEKAQECDCYFKEADALYDRVSGTVKRHFKRAAEFQVANGAIEYAEGGMGDDDPPTAENPTGKVMSVAEEIDKGINGLHVNSQGALVDNGTDNFDYIIVVPYFFEAESSDTIYGAREVLGNMIPPDPNGRASEFYLRDDRDADGTPYGPEDLDGENFTVKVYDGTGWPSMPKGASESYNKGSAAKPTTVIVTSAILSLGNGEARKYLTDAAVKAVTTSLTSR